MEAVKVTLLRYGAAAPVGAAVVLAAIRYMPRVAEPILTPIATFCLVVLVLGFFVEPAIAYLLYPIRKKDVRYTIAFYVSAAYSLILLIIFVAAIYVPSLSETSRPHVGIR